MAAYFPLPSNIFRLLENYELSNVQASVREYLNKPHGNMRVEKSTF